MAIRYEEHELLEKALLRDYWVVEEACLFFLGCVEKKQESRTMLYDLITGNELGKWVPVKGNPYGISSSASTIGGELLADYKDLLARWRQSKHDHSYEKEHDFIWDKNYCLVWAEKNHAGDRFTECLNWGLETGIIKEDELAKVKAGKSINANLSRNTPVSGKELENRLRLIGTMLDILTNEDKKQRFKSQNQLISHIKESYGGHGLSETVLKETFSQAKKLVERKPTGKPS